MDADETEGPPATDEGEGAPSADELAGIVELFGALEWSELRQACSEVAFRRGESADEEAVDDAIEDAIDAYALVYYDGRLVPGPAAFPAVPEGGEDLPHILDVEKHNPDESAVADAAIEQFGEDVSEAVDAGDDARCQQLLDLSYDLETWAPVDLGDERERLDDALPE